MNSFLPYKALAAPNAWVLVNNAWVLVNNAWVLVNNAWVLIRCRHVKGVTCIIANNGRSQ